MPWEEGQATGSGVLCRAGALPAAAGTRAVPLARRAPQRTPPHAGGPRVGPVSRSRTRAVLRSAVGMPRGSGLITEPENTLAFGIKAKLRKCVA